MSGIYQGCGKLTGMVDAELKEDVNVRKRNRSGVTYGAVKELLLFFREGPAARSSWFLGEGLWFRLRGRRGG